MSLDNTIQPKHTSKDKSQASATATATATAGGSGSPGRKTSARKPAEEALKCPRCQSSNTKFCYYNNYSLTQPRHFCKTCRRYWTKGGALRNIPIGGGCRKKKTRSSSCRFMNGDSSSSESSFDIGGLNLFSSLSAPVMDFQLGGLKLNPPPFMNHTLFPLMKQEHNNDQMHGGLTSFQETIESLSSINQELQWKLQQQKLAVLMNDGGGELLEQHDQVVCESQTQKPSMELRNVSGDGLENEWCFDGCFAPVNVDPTNAIAPTVAENYENGNSNNWNIGIHGWDQFNPYTLLP